MISREVPRDVHGALCRWNRRESTSTFLGALQVLIADNLLPREYMKTRISLALLVWLFLGASTPAAGQTNAPRTVPPDVAYLRADTTSPYPFSDAVRVGALLYLSGMIGVDDTGSSVVGGGIESETRQAMENIKRVLERNGSSLDHVVKCTVVLSDINEWPAMNAVYRTYFPKDRLPARTAFASSGLALGARVEIECWATLK
jgi:2-iminobutanoate/2-iminopropanoate deaminase